MNIDVIEPTELPADEDEEYLFDGLPEEDDVSPPLDIDDLDSLSFWLELSSSRSTEH